MRAQRDNRKALVRDVVRDVNVRIEREEGQKRRRAVAFEQEQKSIAESAMVGADDPFPL